MHEVGREGRGVVWCGEEILIGRVKESERGMGRKIILPYSISTPLPHPPTLKFGEFQPLNSGVWRRRGGWEGREYSLILFLLLCPKWRSGVSDLASPLKCTLVGVE